MGLTAQDGKDQGTGRQRALAAGEECQALRPLAGRAGDDLDAAGADVLGVGQLQVRRAAVKQLLEEASKFLAHRVEGAPQLDVHALVEFGDDLLEIGQRRLEIGRLG